MERQISGDISPSEKFELLHLLNKPEAAALFNRLLDELNASELPLYEQPAANVEQIFAFITNPRQEEKTAVKKIRPLFYYAAASVIVLVISGIFFFQSKNITSRPALSTLIKAAPQTQRYLLLPDSSRVILNEGATLSYRAFTGKSREVALSGEAFFDITHDAHRPFIVHTGRIKTTVLGTAFNIKAGDSSHITVTVTRGKVKVEDGNHALALLTPNQQVTVDTVSGTSNNATVDAASVTSWNQQGLKFEDSPLEEVALAIAMRFRRPVIFADSTLKNKHVTAEFNQDESMENILNVITKVNRMRYTTDEEKITISPGE
ncbi:MAG: FecR domain-containing protein [Chitinophagaceae bacterium]|nr:FecR domain-containing protein [Chitinophagaceae bacterium]